MRKTLRRLLIWSGVILAAMTACVGGVAVLSDLAEPIENAAPSCAGGDCDFRITSRNRLGNQNIWIYGEDDDHYYYWREVGEPKAHPSLSRAQAARCERFDRFDVLTWTSCGAAFGMDCAFIEEAKLTYEKNSTATSALRRYDETGFWRYGCDPPEN